MTTVPINIANETVSGITANLQYRLNAGGYGDFTFNADYNTTLKHEFQQFPDDPVDDLLRDNNYYNAFKDIGSGSVNWRIGPWSTTLFGIRYGKTWSQNGSYTVSPWMIYNATVQYNFNDDAAITLIGNNIFNRARHTTARSLPIRTTTLQLQLVRAPGDGGVQHALRRRQEGIRALLQKSVVCEGLAVWPALFLSLDRKSVGRATTRILEPRTRTTRQESRINALTLSASIGPLSTNTRSMLFRRAR